MTNNITIPANAWPFIMAADTDANMTCRQMAILALVSERPGLSNAPIANVLDISRPVVTRAVDRLETLGLMVRMQDDKDRRKVSLTVTAAGKRLLRDMHNGA